MEFLIASHLATYLMNIIQCLFLHQFAFMSCLHILGILNFSAQSQFPNFQLSSSNFVSIGFLGIIWFHQQQHRQIIFSTRTSKTVMSLMRIANIFLQQGTDTVHIFFGPVGITNCCLPQKHSVSGKTTFRVRCYNSIKLHVFWSSIGFNLEELQKLHIFKTFYSVQKARRSFNCGRKIP